MDPFTLIGIFLSTFCFGSVGGTAYAVAHGLSEISTIFILCLMNAAIALIWFGIFWTINSRLSNFIGRRRDDAGKIKFGGMLALTGFTFIFGSFWALIIVYTLNLKRTPALISITVGAVGGGTLWTLGSLGIIWFLPSPWILYIAATCVMVTIIAKKWSKIRPWSRKWFTTW